MQANLTLFDASLPISSIEAYIARVRSIPVLSAQEEQDLTEKFFYHQDLEAARQLIISNLRFVILIAQSYKGYGLGMADLIQEGNIGLMKAIKRFNPRLGVRLISFAVHWIKAEMQEFVIRNWRIVKIASTKAQRKLFFNLRKAKKSATWFNQQEINTIAKDLGVKPKTVREMEARLNAQEISTLNSGDEDEESFPKVPMIYLEDRRYDPASLLETQDSVESSQENIRAAMNSLDKRSQEIINYRWLTKEKMTLHELATRYKVSAERIRQLEVNAMKKLRYLLEEKGCVS